MHIILTSFTDTAISGPMPSPGNKVAVMSFSWSLSLENDRRDGSKSWWGTDDDDDDAAREEKERNRLEATRAESRDLAFCIAAAMAESQLCLLRQKKIARRWITS